MFYLSRFILSFVSIKTFSLDNWKSEEAGSSYNFSMPLRHCLYSSNPASLPNFPRERCWDPNIKFELEGSQSLYFPYVSPKSHPLITMIMKGKKSRKDRISEFKTERRI